MPLILKRHSRTIGKSAIRSDAFVRCPSLPSYCRYNSDGTCDYLGATDACAAGLNEYQTTYIDPLVQLFRMYVGL